MKRLFSVALAVAFLALGLPSDTLAQSIFFGGGTTVPTGGFADFGDGDGAKVGWTATGGVLFPVGTAGVAVGARGFYGSNSHDFEGDKTNLFGGMAMVNYGFGDPAAVSPFVSGQFGFMSHQYKSDQFSEFEGTETGAAFALGGGVGFPLGGVRGFVAAVYQQGLSDISDTKVVAIVAGASIPLNN